ncbi:MAG: hypothetical protein IKA44_06465 [Clostridia bacterium]|nr:hypothetical protein [Clostridia bacterium]
MDREQTTSESSRDPIASAMEQVLAHPELISMVASALGASQKSAEEKEEPEAPPAVATAAQSPTSNNDPPSEMLAVMAKLSPLLSGLSKGSLGAKTDDRRACLLRALKPYVSAGRREAIDYMIGLSQVTDLLKQLS